eukprot:RCo012504
MMSLSLRWSPWASTRAWAFLIVLALMGDSLPTLGVPLSTEWTPAVEPQALSGAAAAGAAASAAQVQPSTKRSPFVQSEPTPVPTMVPTVVPTLQPTIIPVSAANCTGLYVIGGLCTTTCGPGVALATYRVTSPAVAGGLPCPHPDGSTKFIACDVGDCDSRWVDCVGSFVVVGPCSKTCGTGGLAVALFRVTVAAQGGGTPCDYADGSTVLLDCNLGACGSESADCQGGFVARGTCSASCGAGSMVAVYTVTTPAAAHGRPCPFTDGDTLLQPCNLGPCGKVITTCEGFVCGPNSTPIQPPRKNCTGGCTTSDCCTTASPPTCAGFAGCGSDRVLIHGAEQRLCKFNPCLPGECCVPAGHCDAFLGCPAGVMNYLSVICAAAECTPAECCITDCPPPVWSSRYLAPAGTILTTVGSEVLPVCGADYTRTPAGTISCTNAGAWTPFSGCDAPGGVVVCSDAEFNATMASVGLPVPLSALPNMSPDELNSSLSRARFSVVVETPSQAAGLVLASSPLGVPVGRANGTTWVQVAGLQDLAAKAAISMVTYRSDLKYSDLILVQYLDEANHLVNATVQVEVCVVSCVRGLTVRVMGPRGELVDLAALGGSVTATPESPNGSTCWPWFLVSGAPAGLAFVGLCDRSDVVPASPSSSQGPQLPRLPPPVVAGIVAGSVLAVFLLGLLGFFLARPRVPIVIPVSATAKTPHPQQHHGAP